MRKPGEACARGQLGGRKGDARDGPQRVLDEHALPYLHVGRTCSSEAGAASAAEICAVTAKNWPASSRVMHALRLGQLSCLLLVRNDLAFYSERSTSAARNHRSSSSSP